MEELEICPECGIKALTSEACLDCFAPRKTEEPKRKAAKKKPAAKPSKKA